MLVRQSVDTHFLRPASRLSKLQTVLRGLVLLLAISLPAVSFAEGLQAFHSLYQQFLDEHLSPGSKAGLEANMVDYSAVKQDPRLNELLLFIEGYPKSELKTNEQKIAFYLNAYNLLAINKVAENWPLFRLRSLGNFLKPVWTHPVPDVCGEKMTLRKLEHEILRKLGDPRIHFALNCASMSCPDLRDEPYKEAILEEQLEDQTRKFLSQEGKGFAIVGEGEIEVSPLFDWFADDFELAGGVSFYVDNYLPKQEPPWRVTGYLEYNWDVNCVLSAADRRDLMNKKRTWFD